MEVNVSTDSIHSSTSRLFTCIECGYAVEREVPLLRFDVSEVCAHCGEFAVHLADHAVLEAAGRDAAQILTEIGVLTERQALAYVYRELVGFAREETAVAMETSKSNVDNLHRRAREKVEQAERLLAVLCAFEEE